MTQQKCDHDPISLVALTPRDRDPVPPASARRGSRKGSLQTAPPSWMDGPILVQRGRSAGVGAVFAVVVVSRGDASGPGSGKSGSICIDRSQETTQRGPNVDIQVALSIRPTLDMLY